MSVHRRVLVSGPRDEWLDGDRQRLKHGVITRIRRAGFDPQFFDDVRGGGDLVKGTPWSPDRVDAVIRRCVGVAILGLRRWTGTDKRGQVFLPSEYCHYEGSLAYTYDLPILALAEPDIEHRGIFIPYALPVVSIRHLGAGWLQDSDFTNAFTAWQSALRQRCDVFLGYSSRSRVPALKVKAYLKRLGVTVLDWEEDFAPAGSILERIREASAQCSAGVFLFMQDDRSADGQAAPRDNVVFEAGFFAHAKGKERVLIIRERGSKMPADLGGDIYASLTDRSNIAPIKPVLRKFVDGL